MTVTHMGSMWKHGDCLLLFFVESMYVHSQYLKGFLLLNAVKLSVFTTLRYLEIIDM